MRAPAAIQRPMMAFCWLPPENCPIGRSMARGLRFRSRISVSLSAASARWLATGPKILLLDEPTRGIDVGAKAEVQALIDELAQEGLGVLLISSELEEIIDGADRVVVLRDGAVAGELSGDAITEDNILAAIAAEGHNDV